jgi:simple sugar transport system permease protein
MKTSPSVTSDVASEGVPAIHESAGRIRPSWLQRLRVQLERTGMLLVLALLVIVFAVNQPAFLNIDNLFSILQAVSIVALLGIGVTVTLAAGGFDLSVGSVAASAQMAASYVLIVWHGNALEAVAACLVLGVAGPVGNTWHAVSACRSAIDSDGRPFARNWHDSARWH